MNETKRCGRCKQDFPRNFFYKDPYKKDGLMYRCKECQRLNLRRCVEKNPITFSSKFKRYYDKNRLVVLAKWRLNRLANPEKSKARGMVSTKVESGKLIRPKICTECKKSHKFIDAHHPDYNKPLDIIWLCRRCHARSEKTRSSVDKLDITQKQRELAKKQCLQANLTINK